MTETTSMQPVAIGGYEATRQYVRRGVRWLGCVNSVYASLFLLMRPLTQLGQCARGKPLVGTDQRLNADPQTYLCDVLERIVSGHTKNHQLHELLAWNWKAAREAAGQAAA